MKEEKLLIGLVFQNEHTRDKTGGELYDAFLFEGWENVAAIRNLFIKRRWFFFHLQGIVLLLKHFRTLRKCSWVVQSASSGFRSRLFILLCRVLSPRTRHLAIVHHPKWLEDSRLLDFERSFFNCFDHIITISVHIQNLLRQAGVQRPISILPPGAFLDRKPIPAILHNESDLILWSGHLLERKGPHLLLEALTLLPKDLPFRAVFIATSRNDQAFAQWFETRLQASTLQDRIQILDRLPDEEYLDWIGRAGIFCLPSAVEAYSIATVQAMSRGCAIVVPRTANFIELLGEENYPGFFDIGNPSHLAGVLQVILADRLAREALVSLTKARSRELLSWDEFKLAGAHLLQKILGGGSIPPHEKCQR